MIAGGLVNAALDPILIFGFDLELTGAALASFASRIVFAAGALYMLKRHHNGFGLPSLPQVLADLRPVAAIAGPVILTQLATPVGQAFMIRAMAAHGQDAVAGMAVIARLTPVAFGVLFALSGAVGPIIGQNAGAGLWPRVDQSFRAGLAFTAIVTCIVTLTLFMLRGPLGTLFALDGIARDLVFLFAGPIALLWFFNGIVILGNAAFNNLNRPFLSTWINWGRHTLGTIPFVMVGSAWLGAEGVLIGQGVGGVVFGIVAYVFAKRVIADCDRPWGAEPFQRQARFVSLLFNRR
jgi:Na+-driven multidrug efflux pump